MNGYRRKGGAVTNGGQRTRTMPGHGLRHLENRRLQDTEVGRVLAQLGPTDNFPPVHLVSLLLASTREEAELVVSDTTEHQEQPRKHAVLNGHGDVYRGCNLAWRHEPIGDIAMRGEGGQVVGTR